jgi:transcription elongation GreA/GreB family factor
MTFGGPWEADPAKGWINYQAPIAQKVLGARLGDVVEFEHSGAAGQYEVVALYNSLVDKDASGAGAD